MEYLIDLIQELFIGIIGAVIATGYSLIKKHLKNKKEEAKFPVAGKYISTYEDIENGKVVLNTAPVTLYQKGHYVYGTTVFNNDRTWLIEGQLNEKGHLVATYNAEDMLDTGGGNIFLKIDINREMHGLWSGYDHVNDIITSGRYVFKPMVTEFSIRNLENKNIVQCIKIADEQLGEGYFTEEDISLALNDDGDFLCSVIIAEDSKQKDEVIGFAFNKLLTVEQFAKELKVEEKTLPSFVKNIQNGKIAVIKTVVIAEKHQGKGLGYKLIKHICEENFTDIEVIACIGWKKAEIVTQDPEILSANGVVNIGNVLLYNEFEALLELKEHWLEESQNENFACPHCGDICHCSAMIYYRTN